MPPRRTESGKKTQDRRRSATKTLPEWLIPELASGLSYSAIARRARVGRETVSLWMKRPEVIEAVAKFQAELREEALRQQAGVLNAAMHTLASLATNRDPVTGDESDVPHAVRLSAATKILELNGLGKPELKVTGGIAVELPDLSTLSPEQIEAVLKGAGGGR